MPDDFIDYTLKYTFGPIAAILAFITALGVFILSVIFTNGLTLLIPCIYTAYLYYKYKKEVEE